VARSGDTLENPVTRERMTFLETAGDTNGELLRLEHVFAPGGFVPAAHTHPKQEERLEVAAGTPRFLVAGEERTAQPGDVIVVAPGIAHRWWNGGDDETRVLIELRPALEMEAVFEALAALARDGQLDERGFPSPLRGAVLARRFKDEIAPAHDPRVPFDRLPLPVLNALLAALALAARALGCRILVTHEGATWSR
jgi:quercetin dioxygenase-like cupin family protein